MSVIYTISHPITNVVVYVGSSKNLKIRASRHLRSKNETLISKWVMALKNQGLIAKIEVLDNVDPANAKYFERYWISQFTVWGFDLLNVMKTIKSKQSIRHSNDNFASTTISNDTKKWGENDFELGTVHYFKNRDTFIVYFRHKANILNIENRFLEIAKTDSGYAGTVVNYIPKRFIEKYNLKQSA